MTNKSTTENNKDIEDATIVEDKTASSTSEAATSQPIKEKSKKKKVVRLQALHLLLPYWPERQQLTLLGYRFSKQSSCSH